MNYLLRHCILTNAQHGFRPRFLTDTALSHLYKNMYNALYNKMHQTSLFCDVTKAFDTFSHSLSLQKRYFYGIRANALNWFKSYLDQRKQFTLYNVSSPHNA